jgi:hypothetical protein
MGPANNPQIDDATRAHILEEIGDNLSSIIGKSKQRHHELASEAVENIKRKSTSKERDENVTSGGETPVKEDDTDKKSERKTTTSESDGEGSTRSSGQDRQTKSPSLTSDSKAISVSYRKKDYSQSSYRLDLIILTKKLYINVNYVYINCILFFSLKIIILIKINYEYATKKKIKNDF